MSAPAPHPLASPSAGDADPLAGYAGLAGRYDESRAADGSIRPHWRAFLDLLGAEPGAALQAAGERCARAIVEQDVTMNVYAGGRSTPLPWPLDAVPLLVAADEWARLEAGVRQRAELFDRLLADLYGPQELLRRGALPAQLAMVNPHFLRPCVDPERARGRLHHYAVDVARSPDGQWWVLRDRLDAPSGLGYALQNRIIARQALPQVFHRAPVQKLYHFYRDFRASLHELAPAGRGGEEPRVVFLTPGPANEAYFEHVHLAHYLGIPLVEGADLTTRDRQVFLRTVGGLKRVDTLVRRIDSEFCDPLELDQSSLLGVPGLVHAAQGGRVALANPLGAGALEASALLAFLAPLCRTVLGEDLRLPSVATWWCGHEEARRTVLARLDELLVKPAFRERAGSATRYGAQLDAEQRRELAAAIAARPWAYCGQERVLLGTTPAWRDGALQPVPFILRLFVVWENGGYRVMPGGLTRFSPDGDDAIVSLQQGSVTKDTWILQAAPRPDDFVPPAVPLADAVQRPSDTPSRLADNLFWLGRYLERTAQLARLLTRLEPLLRDEIAAIDPDVSGCALRLLLAAQGVTPPAESPLEELQGKLEAACGDPLSSSSLAAGLAMLVRNLDQTKTQLPPEAWRILRALRTLADAASPAAAELVPQLVALEGLVQESLAHDTGWRFLMLGRRIERGQQVVFLLHELLAAEAEPSEFRLQTLLHFADSLFTYRSAYHGGSQPQPVLAWLLAASENPRSLRFQAERIAEHLGELADAPGAGLRALAFRLVSQVRLADVAVLAAVPAAREAFGAEAAATLNDLSLRVTAAYFSHSDLRS
jgi:uncharacterized circularly permuted ATP-grasp superfamily protein/uncharacterized alpha-E superfamily protein